MRSSFALTITANGDAAIGNGNVTMTGANVIAGKAASLSATGHIDLLAAENTVATHSTNSSSNASLGVTFALGGTQNGFSFQIGAQGARGLVNGEETTYSNTQIRVGGTDTPGTLTIESSGDTTLQGATASADKITYDSQQTSVGAGVSICVPPICYGQMVAVSVNAAESKIKADHDSVGANDEAAQRGQSGLKAGDGGFEVKVAGNTTLIGGVITSTQKAVDEKVNSFTTGGTLTTSDLANQSVLDATSVSASISTGSGSTSGSFGYGEVSDDQSSTTQAAISGIAGNKDARTGDAEAGIKPVFTQADAEKINKNLSVQTGITNDFGKNAAKIVGDIAASKMKPIVDAKAYQAIRAKELDGEALSPAEQFQLAVLEKDGMTDAQAISNLADPQLQQDYDNWQEGGIYRVGLHVIAGAMGGGVNGAIGAGASAAAAPLLDDMQDKMTQSLIESGMNPETARATASLIALGTAATAGGLAGGGIQGATTAANIDANNRQLHQSEAIKLAALKKGKSIEEQRRLDAAACALVQCAEGVPTTDAHYNQLKALQNDGALYFAEQSQLKATGEFNFGFYDQSGDLLTSHGDALSRTKGGVNLVVGSIGTVGGGMMAAGGVLSCPETIVGCGLIPLGVGLSDLSAAQASDGNKSLFGPYISSEGQRVIDSFNPEKYPGERDPVKESAVGAAVVGIEAFAAKYIFKGLAAAEDLILPSAKVPIKSTTAEAEIAATKVENNAASGTHDALLPEANFAGRVPVRPDLANQLILEQANGISTAKLGQTVVPRDLNEQVLWNQVRINPSAGEKLPGMNTDERFPMTVGFQKMQAVHELPDGSMITIHYQYNSITGKAYDMKITTPQRASSALQPGASIRSGN